MSVGLSQVDFDPKVLEDEEEAALEKEDQEREQEIRELIANELDDDLLEDDNASFSSHDFRSTANSRASQQLDDSIHQESDSNGNDFADFPPRRGMFEKPPLMTQKGANFISRSGSSDMQPQSSQNYYNQHQGVPQGSTQTEEHGYHSNSSGGLGLGSYSPDSMSNEEHGYEEALQGPFAKGQHGDYYGNLDGQGNYHGNDGHYHGNLHSQGYHGDERDHHGDLDNQGYQGDDGGYHENLGGYHGNQDMFGEQGSFHDNQGSNEYDQGYGYNEDEGYDHHYEYTDVAMHEEQSSHAANGQQNSNSMDQEAYAQTSFPGNYRVQYVPGYRPQPQADGTTWISPHQPEQVETNRGAGHGMPAGNTQLNGQLGHNTVWRDVRQEQRTLRNRDDQEVDGSSRQDGQDPSGNVAQLQILYQARGRKIEELSKQLEKKEEEMSRQIRVLNHKLMLVKDEHAGMTASLEQSQQIAQQSRQETKQVEEKLSASQQRIERLEKNKEQVEDALHTANSTIDSLNEQLVQMTRADALTKAREQHEAILNASRKRQEEEILRLKQKFDETRLSLDWKTEESNRLRDEVLEKGDIINRLTKTLDDTQRQCQELLKTGTVTELASLRTQLQEAMKSRNSSELNCTAMKNEISELQEQLGMYQNALKYGFHGDDQKSESFSLARNLDAESWATPKPSSSKDSSEEEAISGLRQELEHSLEMLRNKTEQFKQLEGELRQANSNLTHELERAERMEKVAIDQEKLAKQLESDLKAYSSGEQSLALKLDLDKLQHEYQECKQQLVELQSIEERLTDENGDLKKQMREMVVDFDKDKQMSLEKCRNACLQLHEDSKQQMRLELEEEHQQAIKKLNDALEETKDELIRVKECYIQLREESRDAEKTIREEIEKEREQLLNKETSSAIEALKTSLNARHQKEIEDARELWLNQQALEVEKAVQEATKHLNDAIRQKHEQDLHTAVQEAVSSAQEEWSQQYGDEEMEKRVAEARTRWEGERDADVKGRVQAAIDEARIEWEDEQREKLRQEVDEAVAETEASVSKIHTERYQKELEHALIEARVTWQRATDESRQKDVEQEVEVAVTNAVAEAKRQWEKELETSKNASARALLAKEKRQWHDEEANERQKAIEAAIAIAEVKWLEEEQRKITRTVDEALHAARTTWADEKVTDIAVAIDDARREWIETQEQEVKRALEDAHAQLVGEFDERTREAVEMAVIEAKVLWQRNHDQNNNQTQEDIESIRDKLWAEFEEQKSEEIQETIEEEKLKWQEKQQERQQSEVNNAIKYLEAQYTRGLEEFKHKELRDALAQARADWEKERDLETDEMLQSRLESERDQWKTSNAQATQVEVDRALATAREAWAANYQDELEQRVMAEVAQVREEVTSHAEQEKQRAVNDAREEANRKIEAERKRNKEELKRARVSRSPESFSKRLEEERSALRAEHEKQLTRIREESARIAREDAERELDHKLSDILHEAKQQWEEELEEERVQLEEQHQLKIRSVLEKAKEEYEIEKQKAVRDASERAVKQQQQLWMNERKTNLSALDKIRDEMTRIQQRHAEAVETMQREHAEEIRKLRDERNKTQSGTQTPRALESGSDTSFSSVDQLTAARGLHELRHQYLETVAKIRDDVLEHVKQTKTTAAKKIRGEVLKERHSTAKKLRRYYLQCLKQLLEEDKLGTDQSIRQKVERMAQALDAVSPDNSGKGQQAPSRPQNRILPEKRPPTAPSSSGSKDKQPKEHLRLSAGRPGEYGPDGESDSPRPSPSDKVLDDPPGKDKYEVLETETNNVDFIFTKGQTSESPTTLSTNLPDRKDITKQTEHTPYQKPLSVQRRSVGSTISVTSNESDYTELPTVIYKSPPRVNARPNKGIPPNRGPNSKDITPKSTLDDIKSRALARDILKNPGPKPAIHGVKTRVLSGSGRTEKYLSRDRPQKSTPPLPSKPTVKLTSQSSS